MSLKKSLTIVLFLIFMFGVNSNVYATNGCGLGDPECGANPVDNCDVTQNTTFTPSTYSIPNGIDICANNVVLDCKDALLQGLNASNTRGIRMSVINGASILNCQTKNYGYGMLLAFSSFNNIINNTISYNQYGIYASPASSYNKISSNFINSNSDTGVYLVLSSNNNTLSSNNINLNAIYGVRIASSTNNTLTNNVFNSNYYGAHLTSSSNSQISYNTLGSNQYGIFTISSPNNTILSNTANSNNYGAFIGSSSSNNNISSNTANFNSNYGIYIDSSSNNTLVNNTANGNNNGIRIVTSSNNLFFSNQLSANSYGLFIMSSSNNTIISNTANSNGVGIYLVSSSSNNLISSNAVNSNSFGIQLYVSSNFNTIMGNNATTNSYGVYIDTSSSNTILNNFMESNVFYGIYLINSNLNLIYNNFFNNTIGDNAWDNGVNVWNSGKDCLNSNIVGGPCIGGNFWHNYNGSDLDGDGIGDTNVPYNSSGYIQLGGDFLPLVALPSPFLKIATQSLSVNLLGQFSSHQLIAIGGTPPYTWSFVNGTLPAGMTLYSDGVINGTPLSAGNFTFTIRVTDSVSDANEKTLTKQVYITLPPPKIIVQKIGTVPVAGRNSTYFIAVTNIDDSPTASDFSVTELLSTPLFLFQQSSPSASTEAADGDSETLLLTWNINLLPSKTSILSYTALLNQSTGLGTTVIGGPVYAGSAGSTGGMCNSQPPQGTPSSPFPFSPLPGSINDLKVCPADAVSGPGGGGYLCRSNNAHNGVDLKAAVGTSIYAVGGGTVEFADWQNISNQNQGCGSHVRVRHANGCTSTYCHLSQINVNLGDVVAGGQLLGLSGKTGNAYNALCPHLHFTYKCPVSGSNTKKTVDPCTGLGNPVGNAKGCSCQPSCAEDVKQVVAPLDPNEKVSIGDLYRQSNNSVLYSVHFENVGNTSALDIFINDTLSSKLNSSSLQVLHSNGTFLPLKQGQTVVLFNQTKNQTIVIGNITVNIPIEENWAVSLLGNLIQWKLLGIDLPVNGTNSVVFSILPNQGLPSGTTISNNATIQFEIFDYLTTNSTVNIIDDTPPSCTTNILPTFTNATSFTLSWYGSDSVGMINSYTIYYSLNGAGFLPLVNLTSLTNATFQGSFGNLYEFICIAQDTAGNTEVQSPITEASTLIDNPPKITSTPTISIQPNTWYAYDVNATDPDNDAITYSLIQKPSGMIIDPTTGLIEWFTNVTLPKIPPQNQKAGIGAVKVNVSVKASDQYGASDIQTYTITVGTVLKFL